MDSKVKQRLWFGCAMLGLALVIGGLTIGQGYIPPELVVLGFVLLITGYAGLSSLARQDRLRKVAAAPAPLASSSAPTTGLPSTWEMGAPSSTDALAASVRFDLSRERAAYKARMRSAILLRAGMYCFLMGLGGVALALGLLQGRIVGVGFGAALIAFGAALMMFLSTIDRAPVEMTVSPDGMLFRLLPKLEVSLRWDDPRFGAKMIATSAEVNRTLDPSRTGPSFVFFTGSGSGVGHGPRIMTEISSECFTLLLREARIHGLRLLENTEGSPGTVSERRIYILSR
jgi:hypothetical protein